jgi:glycosyltransferase involved in cell wall biosynthesis
MEQYPIFLSIVFVVKNQAEELKQLLIDAETAVSKLVADYELIVVDNASTDNSTSILRDLTKENGINNVQVYALTKEVDTDTACWVGLENALGDFIAVVDPLNDDINFLPQLIDKALSGADVVFATNATISEQVFVYRCAYNIFNTIYKFFNKLDLAKEAPRYRLLSKKVVNFVLQHSQPSLAYRHLPATAGFSRVNLTYSYQPKVSFSKSLSESIDRGMRLLVATTRTPMRLVTSLCLFGAFANLLYSVYVVAIAFFKSDVAPGWVSLSLQQSGMFFLISVVLLMLGEYILQVTSLHNQGPPYHVGREFTSAHITRRQKLNIEEDASNVLHITQ